MNKTNETLGTRIANLRKQKGLTQEELGNQLNVSSQAVSKWENDISYPDIAILPELANILEVTVDELLGNKKQIDAIIYNPTTSKKDLSKLMIKVRILSSEGDKVNVNLPLKFVEIFSSTDTNVSANLNISNSKAFDQINWKEILNMVEQGLLGKLVDIESAEGDKVEVYVE